MTDPLPAVAAQVAALARVMADGGLARLGGDAAVVAAAALQTLTALLDPETPMDVTHHALGAARFPNRRPEDLYRDRGPAAGPAPDGLVPLYERAPGRGEDGSGRLVEPLTPLADLIEQLGGAPVLEDRGRPRQCHLRLDSLGADRVLLLVVRFTPHLLTVWRAEERAGDQHDPGRTVFRSGLKAEVTGVYPTWPRTYRVKDDSKTGFARHFTVTAWGDRVDPHPEQGPTDADQDQAHAQAHVDQEGDAI